VAVLFSAKMTYRGKLGLPVQRIVGVGTVFMPPVLLLPFAINIAPKTQSPTTNGTGEERGQNWRTALVSGGPFFAPKMQEETACSRSDLTDTNLLQKSPIEAKEVDDLSVLGEKHSYLFTLNNLPCIASVLGQYPHLNGVKPGIRHAKFPQGGDHEAVNSLLHAVIHYCASSGSQAVLSGSAGRIGEHIGVVVLLQVH
jgi:hypothetical protein